MPRVVVFDETGAPDVLRIIDEPVGEPGVEEVRIKIEAIGINRLDELMRAGSSPRPARLPHARLGCEGTGIVDAVGPGVEGLSAGDAVIITAVPSMDINGTYAEYTVVPLARSSSGPSGWTRQPPRRCGCRTPPPTARSSRKPGCDQATRS